MSILMILAITTVLVFTIVGTVSAYISMSTFSELMSADVVEFRNTSKKIYNEYQKGVNSMAVMLFHQEYLDIFDFHTIGDAAIYGRKIDNIQERMETLEDEFERVQIMCMELEKMVTRYDDFGIRKFNLNSIRRYARDVYKYERLKTKFYDRCIQTNGKLITLNALISSVI